MEKIINIVKLIGSPSALTVEQGDLVYIEIKKALDEGQSVTIDFLNIESIITPFLNASIGRLYEDYTSEVLRERLHIVNQPEGTNRKFNMVIRNAKQFYADKEKYTNIVKEVMEKND